MRKQTNSELQAEDDAAIRALGETDNLDFTRFGYLIARGIGVSTERPSFPCQRARAIGYRVAMRLRKRKLTAVELTLAGERVRLDRAGREKLRELATSGNPALESEPKP